MEMTHKEKNRVPEIQEDQFNCLVSQCDIFLAKYARLQEILKKYGPEDPDFANFIERCLQGAEELGNVGNAYYYMGMDVNGAGRSFKNWAIIHNHQVRICRGIGWLEAGIAYFTRSNLGMN